MFRPHEPHSSKSLAARAGRPAARRRHGLGASPCLGHDEERGDLRARRHGHRRAPRLDLRRHVLDLRDAGSGSKKKGEFTREELQPLAEVNVKSLKEFDFFTYAKAERQEDRVHRPGRLSPRIQHQGHGADAAFHAAAEDAGEDARRSTSRFSTRAYFVDFAFAEKDAVALTGAPAACKLILGKPQEMSKEMAHRWRRFRPDGQIPDNSYGAAFANKISVKCP